MIGINISTKVAGIPFRLVVGKRGAKRALRRILALDHHGEGLCLTWHYEDAHESAYGGCKEKSPQFAEYAQERLCIEIPETVRPIWGLPSTLLFSKNKLLKDQPEQLILFASHAELMAAIDHYGASKIAYFIDTCIQHLHSLLYAADGFLAVMAGYFAEVGGSDTFDGRLAAWLEYQRMTTDYDLVRNAQAYRDRYEFLKSR
jgi:hypothetical protein